MAGVLSSVNSSDNPYAGGGLYRAAPPTGGPTGTIGGFTSSNPPPNVTAQAQRKARNDRGSNITIPYARVVPLSGDKVVSLREPQSDVPQPGPDINAPNAANGSKRPLRSLAANVANNMSNVYERMQYEGLGAGDVAFILRQREGTELASARYLRTSTIGGVGAGVDRMQKLCGFAWLKYSTMLKWTKDASLVSGPVAPNTVPIMAGTMMDPSNPNDPAAAVGFALSSYYGGDPQFVSLAHRLLVLPYGQQPPGADAPRQGLPWSNWEGDGRYFRAQVPDYYDTTTALHQLYMTAATVVARVLNSDPADPANVVQYNAASDEMADALATLRPGLVPRVEGVGVRVAPRLPACATLLVDPIAVIAFSTGLYAGATPDYYGDAELEVRLEQLGLFDWTPDGVVINKLTSGESPFVEGYLNAEMGMMFNVAIQGPAVCKTFKVQGYGMMHRTQPRDEMFVLLTASAQVFGVTLPTTANATKLFVNEMLYSMYDSNFANGMHISKSRNSAGYNKSWRETMIGALACDSLFGGGEEPDIERARDSMGRRAFDAFNEAGTNVEMTPGGLEGLIALTNPDAAGRELSLWERLIDLVELPERLRKNMALVKQPADLADDAAKAVKLHSATAEAAYKDLVNGTTPFARRWAAAKRHVVHFLQLMSRATRGQIVWLWEDAPGSGSWGRVANGVLSEAAPSTAAIMTVIESVNGDAALGRVSKKLVACLVRAGLTAGMLLTRGAAIGEFEWELAGAQQMYQNDVHRTVPSTAGMGAHERRPEATEKMGDNVDANLGVAKRVVLGGWRIGTVMDAAASPLVETVTVAHSMNSALNPSNAFADNLNVGVEWWPASALNARFGGSPVPRSFASRSLERM
jgi:hypothetical protein